MRNIRTEGIVIKRRNLGEADRLLTVITPYFGKLIIKATGVRKITSRRSAHIELLNQTAMGLYKSNGFYTLTEVKMLDDFSRVKSDFTKIGFAYHLCELVDGLCPEGQENGRVYFLLKNILRQIDQLEEMIPVAVQKLAHAEIDDYTLGTYGITVTEAPQAIAPMVGGNELAQTLHTFEIELLSELGYWNKEDPMSKNFDTHAVIETILEQKLKSHNIFTKLQ